MEKRLCTIYNPWKIIGQVNYLQTCNKTVIIWLNLMQLAFAEVDIKLIKLENNRQDY